ncbi:MAG: sulfatase-like hydrolase/transferase [Thermonemataceae bacterium]
MTNFSVLSIIASFLLLSLSGCKLEEDLTIDDTTALQATTASATPNILLIIADDMGKDATAGFTEGSLKPNTPHIDNFKNTGLTFNNFWVYPTCSPTRASIITGKYGYRTGVKWANDVLSNTEATLQCYINQNTGNQYATAIVGKWHLSGDALVNPENFGINYYIGLLTGGVLSYNEWTLTEDGQQTEETSYVTEKFTDLAIDWVNQQSKPWFLWLAYTAPHTPFHAPPTEMHSQGNLPAYTRGSDPLPYYMAMIESMDYQIGRLLDSIPPEELANTIIIFIGDNGTPEQVAQAPYTSTTAKKTLYQGGINTPMFIAGPGIARAGQTDSNLITSTDLFATIATLAGVTVSDIHDSKSFTHLFSNVGTHRDFQYSEMNDGTNDLWTISDGSYKLIVSASGEEEFYDLVSDPYESTNLTANNLTFRQRMAKRNLEDALRQIRN